MTWKIIQGDVRDKLAEIPEKSIQTVVTSREIQASGDQRRLAGRTGGKKMKEFEIQAQIRDYLRWTGEVIQNECQ